MSPLEIVLLVAALALSAFFSGMEIAFVSSSKLRYEVDKADRSLSTRILGIFYRHPDSYISTMLVGNNVVLVIYSILMSRLLDPWLSTWPFLATPFALLLVDTVISTAIVLLFGEFLPKTLFRLNPNNTLRALSLPTYLFYILLYPASLFASWCSRALLRLVGVRVNKNSAGNAFTKMDLDDLIESSLGSSDEPGSTEVQIFQNALDFSTIRVRDCMIPRNEIAAVDKDCPREELLHKFIETGYSKIIVYDETIDNIIGYVHSSDFFREPSQGQCECQSQSLKSLPVVPEAANAQKLMTTLM